MVEDVWVSEFIKECCKWLYSFREGYVQIFKPKEG
jgi:hypothetical protein